MGKDQAGERGSRHKRAGQQVRWSVPNSVVEPTRLALDVGKAKIKESKMTQDFLLELPFNEMGVGQGYACQQRGCLGVWSGERLIIDVGGT